MGWQAGSGTKSSFQPGTSCRLSHAAARSSATNKSQQHLRVHTVMTAQQAAALLSTICAHSCRIAGSTSSLALNRPTTSGQHAVTHQQQHQLHSPPRICPHIHTHTQDPAAASGTIFGRPATATASDVAAHCSTNMHLTLQRSQ